MPKIGSHIKCSLKDGHGQFTAKVLSWAGKATGQYKNCFNIHRIDTGADEWIDQENHVDEWQQVDDEKDVLEASRVNAKIAEIENWKKYKVFEEVKDEDQPCISVRWEVTETRKEKRIKGELVAKGFEEKQPIVTDSLTCSKDSLRFTMFLVANFGWKCNSLDINAAYLQGKLINREICLKPPKEFYNGQL